MSNIGDDFEQDLSKEFGLDRVPGSGNQWHSKLDLHGKGARWSLKATSKDSISISRRIIDEAIRATGGLSGDGAIPIWAFRIGDKEFDVILLRKDDFKLLQAGEIKLINSDVNEQVEQRRIKARTPAIFRSD